MQATACRSIEKAIDKLCRAVGAVSVIILVMMMLFTVADVLLRYFFDKPIFGSLEITEFLMVCMGFLGMAWAARTGMHVKVDVLVSRLSERPQAIIDSINYILVIGVCGLVIWRGLLESSATMRLHMASDILQIPYYPFYWVLAFGYFLLLLAVTTSLVQAVGKAVKK